ncbi:WD repeat-containing protein CG11141 [Pararge aegeria]|uniref:Jg5488 protein n=1 Tax=Pararge aegeria aegeria TaxID=348720 RepID=A0A8S4SLK7_9NEOP|nr:WD repeat-containing protein CG11141 [Pararge aegeria]CAH2268294.1 jg5488 [Pararge aegeria aegeria]
MEVTSGAEEGFVREWTPCSHILNLIPPRIQTGLFSNELCLTCVDAVSEYIALGTNVGLVYWYDRKKGNIQRLRCEASTSPITFVKIVSTVDYMVGAGNAAGQVTVFQVPKEHPENVPDTFKPKVEPKVERYTIGDLHKSKITAIEWSKNGMRLFSGDKNGVIIMTEIDFYMHLCKSMEIVNEEHEIVQMSYYQNTLLVSSVYRSIVCERRDSRWHVTQLGKKERKSLCALGAVFQYSYARGGAAAAYCARPGLRLWRADVAGHVHQTLLFKEAISNPLTVAELLNPSQKKHSHAEREYNFGPLYVFRENFLVSHNEHILYILDPRSLTAVAVVDDLRRILSVSVNKEEMFILEGARSLVRLAHAPEPAALAADQQANLMTKSLTTSLQQAVNTVRDLTHIDQTVPYITSVLEQPISIFTRNETLDTGTIPNGEECFELPPIKHLPLDISDNVLESIINEFKDVSSEVEEIRRVKSEELQKKLKMYNSIMEKKCDEELIHSRRSRRKENGSGGNTPRMLTPVRKPDSFSYTSPCVMNISVCGNMPQNDDLLEKQIEEKEKILAKMLNLESLSIKSPVEKEPIKDIPDKTYKQGTENVVTNTQMEKSVREVPLDKSVRDTPIKQKLIKKITKQIEKKVDNDKPVLKNIETVDLVPKVVKLPNNWNLENIEIKLDMKNGLKDVSNLISSPDELTESEWEII